MGKYAENTTVSSGQSRNEIEKTLARYGASGFMYGWQDNRAVIAFTMQGKQVKFILDMPNQNDRDFTHTPTRGTLRTAEQQAAEYEKAVRQRWRALALVIKAKLEAVESGITIFESEFLAHIVLPNGQTTGDYILPQIESAYSTGRMPDMIPMLTDGR